jgi:quercetin dioxygenase-like cupin family protein
LIGDPAADSMRSMKKLITLAIVGGAFVAGVAVGQPKAKPKATYKALGELTFDNLDPEGKGPKIAGVWGDYKKKAYGAIMKLPAGFTSPMHTHDGAYEAIQIQGTSRHWVEGEDPKAAKAMVPGSYWTMAAKAKHVSACDAGTECLVYVWQKSKFTFKPVPEPKPATPPGTPTTPVKPATPTTPSKPVTPAKP